jgi:hypothetical protein
MPFVRDAEKKKAYDREYHKKWRERNAERVKKAKKDWESKKTPEELSALRKKYRATFLAKNPNYFKDYAKNRKQAKK